MKFKILLLLLLSITKLFSMDDPSKIAQPQPLTNSDPVHMTIEKANILVACGYDLDAILRDYCYKDKEDSHTLLTKLAVCQNKAEVIQVLILGGIAVDKADNWRNIPLIEAAIDGNVETVQVLLDGGADRTITKRGESLTAADFVNRGYRGHYRRNAAVYEQIMRLLTQVAKVP